MGGARLWVVELHDLFFFIVEINRVALQFTLTWNTAARRTKKKQTDSYVRHRATEALSWGRHPCGIVQHQELLLRKYFKPVHLAKQAKKCTERKAMNVTIEEFERAITSQWWWLQAEDLVYWPRPWFWGRHKMASNEGQQLPCPTIEGKVCKVHQ